LQSFFPRSLSVNQTVVVSRSRDKVTLVLFCCLRQRIENNVKYNLTDNIKLLGHKGHVEDFQNTALIFSLEASTVR